MSQATPTTGASDILLDVCTETRDASATAALAALAACVLALFAVASCIGATESARHARAQADALRARVEVLEARPPDVRVVERVTFVCGDVDGCHLVPSPGRL